MAFNSNDPFNKEKPLNPAGNFSTLRDTLNAPPKPPAPALPPQEQKAPEAGLTPPPTQELPKQADLMPPAAPAAPAPITPPAPAMPDAPPAPAIGAPIKPEVSLSPAGMNQQDKDRLYGGNPPVPELPPTPELPPAPPIEPPAPVIPPIAPPPVAPPIAPPPAVKKRMFGMSSKLRKAKMMGLKGNEIKKAVAPKVVTPPAKGKGSIFGRKKK